MSGLIAGLLLLEFNKEYYWNKAKDFYHKKYFGLELLFCSGERIMIKALVFYLMDNGCSEIQALKEIREIYRKEALSEEVKK